MSDEKHTPLPWKLSDISQCGTKERPLPVEPINCIDIYAPNGKGVYHKIAYFTFTSENKKEQLANAELIVQAVNSLAAADELAKISEKFKLHYREGWPINGQDVDEFCKALAEYLKKRGK